MFSTNNIAYGVIAGLGMYVILKLVTFKLLKVQRDCTRVTDLYARMTRLNPMFMRVPGWNVNENNEVSKNAAAGNSGVRWIPEHPHLPLSPKGRVSSRYISALPRPTASFSATLPCRDPAEMRSAKWLAVPALQRSAWCREVSTL
jgi:hypothetical protein